MNVFSQNGGTGRELVPTHAVTDVDREEMRGCIQTLRREAAGPGGDILPRLFSGEGAPVSLESRT